MKVNDILNLSADRLYRLKTNELKALTKSLVDASNKRIKRLEESKMHLFSGAYRSVRGGKKHKGAVRKFTIDQKALKVKTKGGYRNKLLKEFARASRFLKDDTSTIKGTNKLMEDVANRLVGNKPGEEDKKPIIKFKSKAQAIRFWDAYNAIRADYGDVMKARKIGTEVMQMEIFGRIYYDGKEHKNDIDEIINNMRKELENRYVKGEKAEIKEAEANEEPDTPFRIRYEKVKIF